MNRSTSLAGLALPALIAGAVTLNAIPILAQQAGTNAPDHAENLPKLADTPPKEQTWSLHGQNTDIFQAVPAFPAAYSGPNSLPSEGQTRETVSADVILGLRLWRGAEFHLDAMAWQGYGLGSTLGVDGFPNGEAFRAGTWLPNANLARVFVRQTIGLGGEPEPVADDELHLAGTQDSRRLVFTLGRLSVKDIFDNNTYANDPRTQFLNWALMANEAWDYPADTLGYMTGLAVELIEPRWAVRYGLFQVPRVSNGVALDPDFLKAWSMPLELDRFWKINGHPGAARLLGFLTEAHMGSYQEALTLPAPPDIAATRAYRYKYGFGLNLEQEIATDVGAFARLGWSDGHTEAWMFSDVDRTATAGLSLKGGRWRRPNDTLGVAGVLNGLTPVHQQFLAEGGLGILAGDGALNYGPEQILETYYSAQVWKTIYFTFDYQFASHPAFNRDRGPASFYGVRLHMEF